MELDEAKQKFVQSWGTLGSSWGINRTMAQIHALLLIAERPYSANDIKDSLNISMGNTNMNIRELINWGLVYKELIPGERKDFYVAEKDMWEVAKRIITQRKKKELEPMARILENLMEVEGEGKETEAFRKVIQDMTLFTHKADSALENLIKADSNWFISTFIGIMK